MRNADSLASFCHWLQRTPLSVGVQERGWVVPAVQTVHILAIGAVTSSALIISLRSLRLAWRDAARSDIAARFTRIIWAALPVLLASGLLMILAEPARTLENPIFYLKMGLLLLAIAATLTHQRPLRRDAEYWDFSSARRRLGSLLSGGCLVLWVGVIFSGRWIAYIDSL
jgi:hypothetical protein